jgi:amino acid transporter
MNSSSEKSQPTSLTRNAYDIWAMGITVVIGGQYIGWNFGLSSGFASFSIAVALIGSAYICLSLCLAEITSGLPFAGGCYGLTRCMLGYFPGFIFGCVEALEYAAYVATSAVVLSNSIIHVFDMDKYWRLVICFLFFLSSNTIYIIGGDVFWRTNSV